jgi:chaperonin cofactor prefoldin
MSKSHPDIETIVKVFRSYGEEKNYQIQQSEKANNIRLVISNLSERAIVNIYNTGNVVVQGKQSSLKEEIETLKENFEGNPQAYLGDNLRKIRACMARYDIMLPELRNEIKGSLNTFGDILEIIDNPNPNTEYKAKIRRNSSSLTLTQYNNGTLFLQGKTDKIFDEFCDHIEKIANPAEKEVIARFISGDEKSSELFAGRYSPKLIETAEKNVREKMGGVYEYLEPHDQKWFVASECLCLTKIPLPEFSPLVMPASKAFEGFAKKLLIGIGLFESDHFQNKKGNFSDLSTATHPKRKDICEKEKHADTMLKKISLCLDMNRNFMMHSDDS